MTNEINFVMKLCFHLFFMLNVTFSKPGACHRLPWFAQLALSLQGLPDVSWMDGFWPWGFFQVWNDETFSTKDFFIQIQVSEICLEICLTNLKLAKQIGCENLTKSWPTKTRHRFLICACLEICPKILRNLWRLIWLREWRLEGENAMASTEDTSESLCSLRSFKGVVYIVRKYYIYLYIYVYVPPISYMCVYTCVIYL